MTSLKMKEKKSVFMIDIDGKMLFLLIIYLIIDTWIHDFSNGVDWGVFGAILLFGLRYIKLEKGHSI